MRIDITKQEEQESQVWHAVSKIPFGRVATYKQIATLAGLPGHARYVGRCLRLLPANSKLPWHRVTNSKNQLSFPFGSEKYNKQLNAFITIDEASSLSMAKMADDKISKGEHKPLTGIPIAQKDIFCAEGWRTTCGSKMLENFIAPYNATVIQNFNDIDAVNLGKTNMDEFAMGSSNETSYFGPVMNPWNLDCVPAVSYTHLRAHET